MQSPSSSSSSSSPKFSYDVFLSFRGEDTRYGFTGNLYKALSDKGIRTFIDDKELQRGEKITPSLLKSIENSRIAIIIFSKNYASSSFCLDELAHIIHYFQEKSRLVLPVFYDVEPCNVRMRNQTESYAKDLAFHKAKFQNDKENMERFMKWKIALEQAAELSGYDYNFGNKEYEHELITKIVTKISDTINRVLLHVTDHPVGLESKLLEVKSLLDVDCNNGVYMIGICGSGGMEDMGKEIVRQESPKESGERSRLWCHDDIIHVLQENTGTSKIEMIYLNFPSMETVIEWDGDAFKKMKNLKTLIIKNGHFSKGPKYLPNTLRVLKWKGCPSFFPPSATVLNKEFKNMKILNLNNCDYLTEISGISYLPNLEKFSFENCKNLITIHDSSWFLSRLQILNAMGCEKLLSFPPLKFISLLELKLSGCKSLKKFPEILNKMKNIKEIILENTGIQELPFSFQNLSELSFLSINGRGKLRLPSSILKMSNLVEVRVYGYSQLLPKPDNKQSSMLSSKVKRLTLIHHPISDDEFLTIALMWFTNVESLILTGSNLKILPSNLEKCCFLETINLDDCKFLEEIRGVPPNLKTLSAIGCKSLTSSSKRMLMNQEVHEAGGTEFYFPSSRSDRIPEWFEHQRREPSISFGFRNKLPSLVFYFSSKRMRELGCNKKDPADIIVYLVINGEVYSLFHSHSHHLSRFRRDYTYLLNFNIQYWTRYINKFRTNIEIDVLDPSGPNYYESEEDVELFKSRLDEALLRNEWIHAEVSFGFGSKYACWDDNDVVESGFHVIKHLTSMDDFQLSDYCLPEIVKQQLPPPPVHSCSIM
ncbi:TMV resistance protein N [Trifolium repens]|nr:TMV resistance protein N [Trifolium repens]